MSGISYGQLQMMLLMGGAATKYLAASLTMQFKRCAP